MIRWPARKRSYPKLARVQRVLSVTELNPGEFVGRLDQMIAVYAAAMRPPAEMLPGRRSIMAGHAAHPGFRALLATEDGSGAPAGFGYGFHGAAGQWWHDTVARAVVAAHGTAAAASWLDDSFEVAELHVAPDHQGHGVGAGLLLRRLYGGVGFRDLLTGFAFFPGSEPPYAVMGAELPLRARSVRPRSARPRRW